MIIAKNSDVFNSNYDFTDSIIIDISWDSNLLDLLIKVDYYWNTDLGSNELTIRFKSCRQMSFNMPNAYADISYEEKSTYIHSWYTITDCNIKSENGLLEISIKTVDENPKWLNVVCDEVYLEL